VLAGTPLMLAPHARATQRLSLYVPDDARSLGVRVSGAALAGAVGVSFSTDCSDGAFDAGEMSPAIRPLFDEALRTYFGGFVDPLADPRAAFEAARTRGSGAPDSEDVAWALRGTMETVRDTHGWVAAPGETAPARRTLVTRTPEFELRADGTAVVRLHAVAAGDDAGAQAWATTVHDGVAALAARHPRAWIVDLRDHDADSPWPAFAALSTLLDGPVIGASVSRQGTQGWIADRGVSRLAGGPALADVQAPPEPPFRGPIAVLIGPGTRNAGEDLAVAFHGRARTRFVGRPTAGFPWQGVQVRRLSDGTLLGVLETRDADRTGVVQREPVEPDTLLPPEASSTELPAPAMAWLLDERSPGP
jgi:carboxyl-terminal processing protease